MIKKCTSFYALLLVLLLALPFASRADHAAGGEIIYEWVSDSTYRFYFKFYKACSGVTAEPTTATLCYFNSCNTQSGSIPMPKIATLPDGTPNGSQVSTGCPGTSTNCSGGTFPGYKEYWYSGMVTLPSRCDHWTFYVAISARNTSNNIGGGLLYIEATLNNEDAQGNSSPYFSVKPVPYVCVNLPYSYNNGVVDPNSDSLSFEFINPRTAASTACSGTYNGSNLAFTNGFTLAEPFGTNNTFVFDNATGQMSFTPAALSVNTVTVRVNEFRGSKKVGSVMRDVQIRVLACNSVQPTVSVSPPTVTNAQYINGRVEACANNPFSFCFNANSSAGTAILVATDNHSSSCPGSNVVYTGQTTPSITGCFSWTPTAADTGLRIFTVTVKDSTCAPPGVLISQTFVLPIYIRPATATLRSFALCPGKSVQLTANGTNQITWDVMPGGSPLSTLSCTNCQHPVATPDTSTIYYALSTLANGCNNTDTVKINVDESNEVQIAPAGPVVLCRPDLLQLNVTTTGPRPLKDLACSVSPGIPPTPLASSEIIPFLAIVNNMPGSASTPLKGNYITARHQYLLHASDMRQSGMQSGSLKSIAFRFLPNGGSSSIRNVKISLKCTPLNALDPNAGFEPGTIPVYNSPAVTGIPLQGGYVQFDFPVLYNWDVSQNLIVDICYANNDVMPAVYTSYAATNYVSTLYAYAASGNICAGTIPGAPVAVNELPLIKLGYHLAPETDWAYHWTNSVYEPNANVDDPRAYVSASKQLYVSTINRHGCELTDTLDIYMPHMSVRPKDTSICVGDVVRMEALNGENFAWYENGFNTPSTLSCSNCATPIAQPSGTTSYTAVIGDHGCLDTFHIKIKVTPYPVLVVTSDTTVKYGSTIQLQASGADKYLWSPAGTLNDPTLKNPIARPEEPTAYIVAGMPDSNNNCRSYDTVRVSIDYDDHLFIPTAFTPNGDGRNDEFRVVNLSFRKLQEFRVFNRWGQEVFSTTNNTKGWDGMVKGSPQEMGIYHYIIRVSVPDGRVVTYKGDVTLVR